MDADDEFLPRLGRMRSGGSAKAKSFLNQALAATSLARGGPVRSGQKRAPPGSRIGRGGGAGAILAGRGETGGARRRRVVVKSRIVKLAGRGGDAARAHLRYIQRDGVTREGSPGELYDAEHDRVAGKDFIARGAGDRHQFRLIVSAEDGAEYDELKSFTRQLMTQMEEDLGTRLDWVAVDHFNTAYPHTHIILRGKDDRGKDLVIARDYLAMGMRTRAADIVQRDLGPRTDLEIRAQGRREIGQERMTGIDRAMLRNAGADRVVQSTGRNAFDQTLRVGRLRKLEQLGLATQIGQGWWRLSDTLEIDLKRMGERGDIIKALNRALTAKALDRGLVEQLIYEPDADGAGPLVGRLVERGLSDELEDRHYLILDGIDGRSHYVAIGLGSATGLIPENGIVRVTPSVQGVTIADRTIEAVAAANGGYYDVEAHLRFDLSASETFAETHVRRLEAMRKILGNVERRPDGRWVIEPDHLERAAAYAIRLNRNRPVAVETLSAISLGRLTTTDGATWLDRQLVATEPETVRDAGFGREVRSALALRRQWLVDQELAGLSSGQFSVRANLLALLQRRELLRVAAQLSEELGLRFVETDPGQRVAGRFSRQVDMASGKFALVEKSKAFTLVPWRPVLARRVGQEVGGIMRENGVNWSFGVQRSGPSIS